MLSSGGFCCVYGEVFQYWNFVILEVEIQKESEKEGKIKG
jgi:hypothetical protein